MTAISCLQCKRLIPEGDPACVFCGRPLREPAVQAPPVPDALAKPGVGQAADVPEALLRETLDVLRAPKRVQGRALLLISTVVLFFLAEQSHGDSLVNVIILIGVLFFHEAGHYVAMRVFGYRDLRMFFIPFLGAALSGVPRSVPAWQRGVVALAGPLPGIVVGSVLFLTTTVGDAALLRQIAITALVLNGFNLLPVPPLDGGRVLELVLASRKLRLEIGAAVLGAVALCALMVAVGSSASFLAGLIGAVAVTHLRIMMSARSLRDQFPAIPDDPLALDDVQARALFQRARDLTRKTSRPRRLATMMEMILSCTVPPPSMRARGGLMMLWMLGVVLAVGSFAGQGYRAGRHVHHARVLKEQGDLDGAVRECREAVRLAPEVALMHLALGVALRDAHDIDGAVQEDEEARRLKPDLPEVHNALGLALLDKGNALDTAVREFEEYARLKPQSTIAHNNVAFALEKNGDLAGAVRQYREALRLDPNQLLAHRNLAPVLIKQGDTDGALAELREVARLDPKAGNVHGEMGNLLHKQGAALAAIAEYREALRLDPDQAAVHNNLGLALQEAGQLSEAIAEFREAVRIVPSSAVAHTNLGATLRASGDLDAAIVEFREAARVEPNAAHQRNLAAALREQHG